MGKNKLPNENVARSTGEAYENAHVVQKGDPRIDGPYLDDIRAAQEEEYRRQRNKGVSQVRDEELEKKKDVVFHDFRALSQQQHDENRYHEEKSVEESVKAQVRKIPKTPIEKAGEENRELPGTDSKRRATKKASATKAKAKGDTPKVKVNQKTAKPSDRPTQPSNDTLGAADKGEKNPRPETTTDEVVKPGRGAKSTTVLKKASVAKEKVSDKTRPTDREQMAVDPAVGHKGEKK